MVSSDSDARRGRRLVVCLDGTWNTEGSFTNIWRLYVALRRDTSQLVYYDQGVGTKPTDYVTGGGFGRGLSNNVLRAFLWLTEHHRQGDEIFVFGFSRGAYTARSLVGFLSVCGLLRCDAPVNIDAAFAQYRKPGVTRESDGAVDFRARYSLEPEQGPPRIRCLGVFDTVGALGIPVAQVPLFEDYRWHKVHLSEIVDHAYHALAIDEHRELFDATLWRNRYPHQTVEQRWFVGAHANVGGGYEYDALSIRPLEWMQQKAKSLGLVFDYDPCRVRDPSAFLAAPINDSYGEFLWGTYSKVRAVKNGLGSPRHYRTIGSRAFWHPDQIGDGKSLHVNVIQKLGKFAFLKLQDYGVVNRPAPTIPAVGEFLDGSVDARVRRDKNYRPQNLQPFFDPIIWET